MHKSWRSSKFGQIGTPTAELGALECLKESPYIHNGENDVSTFFSAVLIGSLSYLKVKMTYIRACKGSKFGQI